MPVVVLFLQMYVRRFHCVPEEGGRDALLPVRHNDCSLGATGVAGIRAGSTDSPHLPLLCLEQVRNVHRIRRPPRCVALLSCLYRCLASVAFRRGLIRRSLR